MKHLAKKLNDIQQQLKDETQKLNDREEDLKKMQEDYDGKVKEVLQTLAAEQKVSFETDQGDEAWSADNCNRSKKSWKDN